MHLGHGDSRRGFNCAELFVMEHIQKRSQSELEAENEILRGQVAELTAKIEMLTRKITELAQVSQFQHKLPGSNVLVSRLGTTNESQYSLFAKVDQLHQASDRSLCD